MNLYDTEYLYTLHDKFLRYLAENNAVLYKEYLTKPTNTNFLVDLAPYIEDFIVKLFEIEDEVTILRQRYNELSAIITFKRKYIIRNVLQRYSKADAAQLDGDALRQQLPFEFSEESFAKYVMQTFNRHPELVSGSNVNKKEILKRVQDDAIICDDYIAWACLTPAGQAYHKDGFLFRIPRKYTSECLIDYQTIDDNICAVDHRPRSGFDLTDQGKCDGYVTDHAHYCIWCHPRGKDTCSSEGCPLEQKISEMNQLRASGNIIGALAVIIIDNPMVAATGHRICNDCMKTCIYQKQEPVDIPSVESSILKDVLHLPWGFEIYSLLTRWNPLNLNHPLPKPNTNKTILVSGMGPAGFTLAHYLLQDGHNVIGIDKLQIEPLPIMPSSPQKRGSIDSRFRGNDDLIKDITTLFEPLSKRKAYGFGGVAEYGITVRWDKNYLQIVRLLLQRRANFTLRGGEKLDIDKAFESGIDHIAICHGTGKANAFDLENIKAAGVYTAMEFLTTLHRGSPPQVAAPIVVIGGGLTAVDCATETLAIVGQSGSTTIAYRKSLTESPAYRLNHEELANALTEGVYFQEHINPQAILVDEAGHVAGLKHKRGVLPAKTIIIAVGTQFDDSIAPRAGLSFYGDADPKYAGSVVKAMASAKHGYREITRQVLEEDTQKPRSS